MRSILILLGFLLPAIAPAGEVRLTNGDWPPFLSPELPDHGTISRKVRKAFHQVGVNVEFGFFPWKRSLALAAQGSWDGSVAWRKTPERERDFYFSEPLFYCNYVFFHRRQRPIDWRQLAELRGYRIGATLEYDYGPAFRQAWQQRSIQVDVADTDEQNLRKLLAGRIDLFPVTREVGEFLLQTRFTPEEAAQLTYHPRPLLTQPMYLLLNRKRPEHAQLIKQLNRGLRQLQH